MRITETAKHLLLAILKENEFTAIKIVTEEDCCGKGLGFDLVLADEEPTSPEMIDGVPVYMDDETCEWTGEIIIDEEDGMLVLIDPNAEHSHDCGCDDDDCGCHDDDCGCDDDDCGCDDDDCGCHK